MADPLSVAGLALAVVTTFKEVYVTARSIYRMIESARNMGSEREDLQVEFRGEILYLESFGKLYLSKNGLMNDVELDKVSNVETQTGMHR